MRLIAATNQTERHPVVKLYSIWYALKEIVSQTDQYFDILSSKT